MARVDEMAGGIYRISTTVAMVEGAFQSNQFLMDDEMTALIQTGNYPLYEDIRNALDEVIDTSRLA